MRSPHRRSKDQEKKIAKAREGEVTIASGALPWQKADVVDKYFLTEAKYTDKKSYSITKATWEKIKNQSQDKGLMPSMVIDITGTDSLTVIRSDDFNWMIQRVNWEEEL